MPRLDPKVPAAGSLGALKEFQQAGKIRHEVNKYVRRSRRQVVPEGFAGWEFLCRVGASSSTAEKLPLKEIGGTIGTVALTGATEVYVEILAVPAQREPPAPGTGVLVKSQDPTPAKFLPLT